MAGVLLLAEPGTPPLAPGEPAPDFSLPEIGAEGERSLAETRGDVVLLNFWATWCKPCEDEMPAMERLHRDLASEGLRLWAVSVDVGSEEVVAFRERLGLTFPILHDPDRDVADLYRSYRFPETWLIDRRGTLAARFIGPRDWDSDLYRERFRELLAQPAAATPGAGSRDPSAAGGG